MSSEKSINFPPFPVGDGEYTIMSLGQDKMYCMGPTVPTDAATGYAKGCIFIDTDGSTTTSFYVNMGSTTSCNFDAPLP